MHASCAEKADMYVEEFQMEDEEESIQYHVHCPTHDPVSTRTLFGLKVGIIMRARSYV